MKIVIIGGGKVGSKLSEELSNESHDVTVIEQDVDVINRINSNQDVACINGNAINREILRALMALSVRWSRFTCVKSV